VCCQVEGGREGGREGGIGGIGGIGGEGGGGVMERKKIEELSKKSLWQ